MAFSPVATGIFSIRNADKTSNGDIGRLPVTIGQAGSVVKATAQYDNIFSKSIKNGLEIAKNDAVLNKIGKVVKFAGDNVNPLICVSSGLKVVMADEKDKKNTLITEAGCLAGMFLGEGWMKKNLDKILDKSKLPPKISPIVKGIVFVTGSILSSTIGEKLGAKIAQYMDKKPVAEIQPIENYNSQVYTPMNFQS